MWSSLAFRCPDILGEGGGRLLQGTDWLAQPRAVPLLLAGPEEGRCWAESVPRLTCVSPQAARHSHWTSSSCWMPQPPWGPRTSPRCRAL